MLIYASTADLTTGEAPWLATAPASAGTLLRQASIAVAAACNRDPYTDTAPVPEPLRDATCAQVAYWVTSGIDPTQVATPLLKRSELLDGKVEYDTSTQAAERVQAVERLCELARSILTVAGLLYVAVPLFDDSGALDTWGLDVPHHPTRATPAVVSPHPIAVNGPADADPATTMLVVRRTSVDTEVAMGEFVIVQSNSLVTLTILPEPMGSYCRVKLDPAYTGTAVCIPPAGGSIDNSTAYPLSPPGSAVGLESVGDNIFAIF